MVTVQQVVQYYSLFFQNIVYDSVKHNDKIMTEWQYFSQLVSKTPIDQNRIQTYLDIICLNKKQQQQLPQKNKPIPTDSSQLSLLNNNNQHNLQLRQPNDENIDTDFDDNDDDSPSSNSSGENKERQVLVFKDEETDQEEDMDNQDELEANEQQYDEDDDAENLENVMIIERKCFDDELNNIQQIPVYTSTSPTIIKRSSEFGDYKKSSQIKINQIGVPFTPNTCKSSQPQKFSFSSNDQPLNTRESSSPILKEVTSNFQNIKTTPNYNKNNYSQQPPSLVKQSISLNNNFTSSFNHNNQPTSHNNNQNNENIYGSQNDFSKSYNVNFKISQQRKENIENNHLNNHYNNHINNINHVAGENQKQSYSSSFSSKNVKNLTPSLSHLSITNKSLKNILHETSMHTKSLEQNLELIDMQVSTEQPFIATPLATDHGSGYKKRDIAKAFLNMERNSGQNRGDGSRYLKTQPSASPIMHNLQPPIQPICQTSTNGSSNKDLTLQEIEHREQQFQISQNQEFESVSERKSLIKITQNKTPFSDTANLLPISIKPPYTPTEDNKRAREFNSNNLRKQLTDVVTFFEGNNKKIGEILDKMPGNTTNQQQGIYQLQQNYSVGQLGLIGAPQYHRLGISSNQMTPQSIMNQNNPNYNAFPSQNFYPAVSKQASQIQLFFQPTPPPPPPPPHSTNQIQNQQQQIQQLYGYPPGQQQQQVHQTFQQFQQRHNSHHNGVSNQVQLHPQQPLFPLNLMQPNNNQLQQQSSLQYPSMSQPQIGRQNLYQPPLIPIKQASCPRGSSESNGGRSVSTYSRDTSDGQVKTMFKRMRTYDNCGNTSASQIPSNGNQKNLNRTMDENINNSNNLSSMTLNTSKLNLNQPGIPSSNNISCTLNLQNNENNRYLTNSTNQLTHPNQNASSQEIQQRKRSEYSFPDLKSFNKYIKK